jgi:hypothetical protein
MISARKRRSASPCCDCRNSHRGQASADAPKAIASRQMSYSSAHSASGTRDARCFCTLDPLAQTYPGGYGGYDLIIAPPGDLQEDPFEALFSPVQPGLAVCQPDLPDVLGASPQRAPAIFALMLLSHASLVSFPFPDTRYPPGGPLRPSWYTGTRNDPRRAGGNSAADALK